MAKTSKTAPKPQNRRGSPEAIEKRRVARLFNDILGRPRQRRAQARRPHREAPAEADARARVRQGPRRRASSSRSTCSARNELWSWASRCSSIRKIAKVRKATVPAESMVDVVSRLHKAYGFRPECYRFVGVGDDVLRSAGVLERRDAASRAASASAPLRAARMRRVLFAAAALVAGVLPRPAATSRADDAAEAGRRAAHGRAVTVGTARDRSPSASWRIASPPCRRSSAPRSAPTPPPCAARFLDAGARARGARVAGRRGRRSSATSRPRPTRSSGRARSRRSAPSARARPRVGHPDEDVREVLRRQPRPVRHARALPDLAHPLQNEDEAQDGARRGQEGPHAEDVRRAGARAQPSTRRATCAPAISGFVAPTARRTSPGLRVDPPSSTPRRACATGSSRRRRCRRGTTSPWSGARERVATKRTVDQVAAQIRDMLWKTRVKDETDKLIANLRATKLQRPRRLRSSRPSGRPPRATPAAPALPPSPRRRRSAPGSRTGLRDAHVLQRGGEACSNRGPAAHCRALAALRVAPLEGDLRVPRERPSVGPVARHHRSGHVDVHLVGVAGRPLSVNTQLAVARARSP